MFVAAKSSMQLMTTLQKSKFDRELHKLGICTNEDSFSRRRLHDYDNVSKQVVIRIRCYVDLLSRIL